MPAAPHLRRARFNSFQSLYDVDVTFGQVTVFVGPNNVGKSAVLRAIQAALFNRQGGSFVSMGSPKTVVSLDFVNGSLTWTKKDGEGGIYEITVGGKTVEATRATVDMPPQVYEVSGVREVQLGVGKARLQFADQFGSPFLIGGSGSQAAKLLAHVAGLDVLMEAQSKAKGDRNMARDGAKAKRLEADRHQEILDAQPAYDELVARWDAGTLQLDGCRERDHELEQEALAVGRLGSLSALTNSWAQRRVVLRLTAAKNLIGQLDTDVEAWRALSVATAREAKARTQAAAKREEHERTKVQIAELAASVDECPFCGRVMP